MADMWSLKKKANRSESTEKCEAEAEPPVEGNEQGQEKVTESNSIMICSSEDEEPTADIRAEARSEAFAESIADDDHLCTGLCCSDEQKVFQPTESTILSQFVKKDRKFLPVWYQTYDWITLCTTTKKVFCIYCRFASKHKLLLSKRGDEAFSLNGFDNYKKATQKFQAHEKSDTHLEAKMKFASFRKPSVQEQLSTQAAQVHAVRRSGLLKQLEAMKYLLRQGIALRGRTEEEGNLPQLLAVWSKDSPVIKDWIREGKYLSHDIVNEMITSMGLNVLRQLLVKIKSNDPFWYAIIADEATDVSGKEQCNLSIRHVDNNYEVSEDAIGLYSLPNTAAATLALVVKDVLTRCALPLSLCRGQAYDGAANMQGKRKGLATIIKKDAPAALSVHCLAHSLNLCLQDVGRQNQLLRDGMDIVREIVKLINYSPKRKHLFSEKLLQADGPKCGIKPLCPTRWTVRTEAIDAVVKQYSVIMETMEDIHRTTHDEYGLKAGGILAALEKFDTLFGLKLGHLLFSASEETSRVLQAKDTSLQEAKAAVSATQSFYKRQRKVEAFDKFYQATVALGETLQIGSPKLPRYRKPPQRFNDGSQPHQFSEPKDYFRQQYFASCDLLFGELTDRFDQKEFMQPVLALESLLLKSANGEDFGEELQSVQESVYQTDFDFAKLKKQLGVLVDVIHEALPEVRQVTSIRTICEAMTRHAYRTMLSEVHKLLRLYLTVPITTATSERAFSTLRRLLTYLRSTMTEQRLNNCMLLHVHKTFTDNLDLREIAKEFISANEDRQRYFGHFELQ